MKRSAIEVGARVRIEIHDPEAWATGAVACLNGSIGVIEKVLPDRYDAGGVRECPVLVRFDEPLPHAWASHRPDISAYHFHPLDLVPVPT